MLIHAMLLWPDIIKEQLWPYTIHLSFNLHNCTPGPSGFSSEEIFTGIKGRLHLPNFHPFGCPVFVLDPTLQQGHKIPRWWPCWCLSWIISLSCFIGPPCLKRTTNTGLISPPFHIIFEDYLTTTKCLHSNVLPPNFSALCSTSSEKLLMTLLTLLFSLTLLGIPTLYLLLRGSTLLHYLLLWKNNYLLHLLFKGRLVLIQHLLWRCPLIICLHLRLTLLVLLLAPILLPVLDGITTIVTKLDLNNIILPTLQPSISTILPSILPLMSPFIIPSLLFKIHTQSNLLLIYLS